MTGRFKSVVLLLAVIAFVFTLNPASNAEAKRVLITQRVDESQLTTLFGNTRPEANVMNDRGLVSPDLQFNHMLLLLQRSPESEKELEQFIEEQHNPDSANFHKWLGAAEFGQRFGLVAPDIANISQWLQSYGLKVEYVYLNRMVIDFSGTASQIESAFRTQFHYYMVDGELYIANNSDPKIPSALAKAVVGPVYLNNFHPRAMHEKLHDAHIDPATGGMAPDYTAGGGYPLVPYDLQKIYNIAPLYPAGISGQGMTIVVVEDTNLWNCNSTNTPNAPCSSTSDWAVFRNTFGLGKYTSGNLSQENPGTTTTTHCSNPSTGRGYPSGSGINGDDVEAAIDVEWATAVAPNATIINAACANPSGGFVPSGNPPNK